MQSQILSPLAPGWQAQLTLAFQQRGLRTTLGHCAHHGPLLQVQQPFYPEGEAVGHVAILLCAGVWPDRLNPLRTALNRLRLEANRFFRP